MLSEKMFELGGFDHNVQALRVVGVLENRYAEHDGLNLTWETLEGILKHNGPVVGGASEHGQEIEAVLAEIPASADLLPETYACLEAQVAAIADDIAYNAHDIDDAVRAGLLVIGDLADVPLVGPIAREVIEMWPGLERGRQIHEVQRRLITRTIEAVIAESAERLIDAGPKNADDVRRAGRALIGFPSEMAVDVANLKAFLFAKVYRDSRVMGPVRESEAVVGKLFDAYFFEGDMPGRWGLAYSAATSESARARIVCDFVAGMTDPFALDEHARLFDERPEFR